MIKSLFSKEIRNKSVIKDLEAEIEVLEGSKFANLKTENEKLTITC